MYRGTNFVFGPNASRDFQLNLFTFLRKVLSEKLSFDDDDDDDKNDDDDDDGKS